MFPVKPKRELFERPKDLKPGFGTTITDEGHIFGYLTLWNVRLIGSGRKNTKPPKSKTNYTYANAFNLECADGNVIRTGVLSSVGGHHYEGNFEASQAAYADTSRKVANVVYGEDKHGVWFSGALCSHVDEAQVQNIRSSGVSGHWERPAPGKPLELLGACSVNIPGFAQAASHRIVASATFTPDGGVVIEPEISNVDNGDSNGTFRIKGPGSRITAAASRLVPISGVLAALGTPTIDGRMIDAAVWDRLPLPLWYLDEQTEWGHQGAKIVGNITNITPDGSLLRFTGFLEEEFGEEAYSAEVAAGLDVLGISMDGLPSPDSNVRYEYDEEGWPNQIIFEEYQITGATLTFDPAFRETVGVTTGTTETPVAAPAEPSATTGATDEVIAASANVTKITPPMIWR